MPTAITGVDVPTHRGSPARLDVEEHSPLRPGKRGPVIPKERSGLTAKDVGYFQAGSAVNRRQGCGHQGGGREAGRVRKARNSKSPPAPRLPVHPPLPR